MSIHNFTIPELLQVRTWMVSILNSTSNFIHTSLSQDDIRGIRKRLKEIDEELVERVVKNASPFGDINSFRDVDFEATLQEIKKEAKPKEEINIGETMPSADKDK